MPRITPPTRLLLASGSPRRRELLEQAGFTLVVRATDVDETVRRGESPKALVARLAKAKAHAALAFAEGDQGIGCVVAADTTVAAGTTILNKPRDDAEAARMLKRLAGKVHMVHTGVCVATRGKSFSATVTTRVWFRALGRADIERYVATGESRDKAGAYGIQGIGGGLVDKVSGSYTNIVGLPLPETLALIARAVALSRS